jgi:hypothetical protein
MLRMAKQTGRPPEEVLAAAARFFGPDGVGLKVSHRSSDHISLEGGGGFITVAVTGHDSETEVSAVTREWESDVRQFLTSL